jgi:excisionase family DNA binding protein
MDIPLCANCSRPAVCLYDMGDYVSPSCGRCVPAGADAARPLDSAPPEPVTQPPLTVAEAAERERVSDRTIRRWLPALEAADGAWRIGAQWRIDPAALDARRAAPRPAITRVKRPQRRKAATAAGEWQA